MTGRGGVSRTRFACVLVGLLLGVGAALFLLGDQQRIQVVSASMAPTIEAGATIWMDTSARGGTGVRPGDIVVFADPGGWNEVVGSQRSGMPELIAKRVIAVGGQTLSCCDPENRLVRDGRPATEPYLPIGVRPSALAFEVTVPAGHLWVMGDNRSHSLDSRQRALAGGSGFVPLSAVRGVVRK